MSDFVLWVQSFGLPTIPWISVGMQPYAWLSLCSVSVVILTIIPVILVRSMRHRHRLAQKETDASLLALSNEVSSAKHALKQGLARTRGGLFSRLSLLFAKKKVDAELLEQLEEILFTADVGAKTAHYLFERVKVTLSTAELLDKNKILEVLRHETRQLLDVPANPIHWDSNRPFILLMIGVNGAGKTTTIGKLASRMSSEGKKVMLIAGDTFRAAAVQQLQIWGERVNVPVSAGKEGSDPSSVIFDGIRKAQQQGVDVLIADTAGRLHVKAELMEELKKVRRVIQKADPSAPHETWLVLDATNGQNAIAQAATFKDVMDITGIVLTKLDGTAKGGVILGICHELQIPVRFVGVGETMQDLQPFDKDTFVDALYDVEESV